ncbi:MAG: DNA-binding protein [Nitrospinota bacterium]|nr:MAG: DNA-binding protein [Nitrospinota bacterium]
MAEIPTLYLESTIPSYLAARPSRDLIVAAHQQITHEWWQQVRSHFDIYISETVLAEISAGDPEAASRRLALVEEFPILALTEAVERLATQYQEKLGLPPKAQLDVIHLACAVVYEMDYLLTWNCTHIANGIVIYRLQTINTLLGLRTPVIVTPEELLVPPEGG